MNKIMVVQRLQTFRNIRSKSSAYLECQFLRPVRVTLVVKEEREIRISYCSCASSTTRPGSAKEA
jgi:hypothetical protein